MLEVINHTPLESRLFPSLDVSGYDYATIVMKGNFTISDASKNLVFNEEPAEIFEADVYFGETNESSVRYESDTSMYKRRSDIVINGHAYAPAGRKVSSVDAIVKVANKQKTCRVTGDRYWEKSTRSVMSWNMSQPQTFEKMPIVYERAFGGIDLETLDTDSPEFSPHNPIGTGFLGDKSKQIEGIVIPNIEDPRYLISDYKDKPPVSGFGFISRSWQPRMALAGTYDDKWMQERNPLLPLDFNDNYFNGAHPDLICDGVLQGGEAVSLANLSENGLMEFNLPVWNEKVVVSIKGKKQEFKPSLDTVVIEPDIRNVMITWRVTVPCYKQFLYLDSVKIGKKRQHG
ncbi:MAG: DUF2169 domain-containing protein [Gammaproteobacteria bacterium]|nr:DUF2169 domain-containing protein [Gammaproteobacteria bacterium]